MSFLNLSLAADISSFLGFSGVGIVLIGFIVLFLMKGKAESQFANYCQKVSNYLSEVGKISKANEQEFTDNCFGEGAPESMKLGWQAYCNKPFGYPSDYFDVGESVPAQKKDKFRKIFLPMYVVLIALAFAASFLLDTSANKLYSIACVPVGAGLWLVLLLIKNKLDSKIGASNKEAFDTLMDDMDVNVFTQNLYEYVRDVSDLQFVTKAIEEIADFEASKPLPVREKVYINENGEKSNVANTKKAMKIEEAIKQALDEKSAPAPVAKAPVNRAYEPQPVTKINTQPYEPQPVTKINTQPYEPQPVTKINSQPYEPQPVAKIYGQQFEQKPFAQYEPKPYVQSENNDFSVDPIVYPPIKFEVSKKDMEQFTATQEQVFEANGHNTFAPAKKSEPVMPSEPIESFENSYVSADEYNIDPQINMAYNNKNSDPAFPTAEPVDEKVDDPFNSDGWDEIEIERNSDGKNSFWKAGRKNKR